MQYQRIGIVSFIITFFEFIINKKDVERHSRYNLLRNKQYGSRLERSTTDVLAYITHKINVVLENKFITRNIDLYISKAVDKA